MQVRRATIECDERHPTRVDAGRETGDRHELLLGGEPRRVSGGNIAGESTPQDVARLGAGGYRDLHVATIDRGNRERAAEQRV
jgi:hypothetical protein